MALYRILFFILAIVGLTATVQASDNWRMVGLVFDAGEPAARIEDALEGDESAMYRFVAKDGQRLSVSLAPRDQAVDFIVYAPGRWPGDQQHDSGADGNRDYEGRVDRDGHWAILVYRDLTGGVPSESAAYELVVTLE